jgi:sulfate permease, SulP family
VTALLPASLRAYDRAWLRPDVIAGVVIWSVVTPQAVAYAQIAGLPPEAGLMAAPVAMGAYALLGTSHQLVVSATTATSAVSAATVGALAGGDVARFAALSAAFALVVGVVLAFSGWARFGAVADLVSKPVMTGFLFGLGLVITLAQVPDVLGVAPGEGDFFPALADVLGELGDVHGATLAVGAVSIALLVLGKRYVPGVPATLVVLALAIVVSALFGLEDHGVDVVGHVPTALPDPAVPHVSAHDFVNLVAPAIGVLVLSAEAVGVARGLAAKHDYQVDPNRDLVAMGAANVLCGLSSGFVQSGGASQTAAADGAGGRSQLASLVAVGLLLLTGAFLAPLFTDLPQATLAAIVIVAVAGFLDVAELRRYVQVRRSAVVFAGLALAGVLALGVLQGLVVAAVLSLMYIVKRLSRPTVAVLARDPRTGAWGHADRHDSWQAPEGVLVVRCAGPLFYANANAVKDRVLALAAAGGQHTVVLDLDATDDLDVQGADTLAELAAQLRRQGMELRLARVRAPVSKLLERAGIEIPIDPTLTAAAEARR